MLYIRGGNKEQIVLSQQLFSFCSNGLFQANNIPNIDLTIQKVDDALAWTDYEGDGKFFIEIEESLDRKKFIITLCHEMIHVCQFLAGVEVSELSAYHYEEELAEQFYQEELGGSINGSLSDLKED
ncbi:hypothetical protein N8269_05625 [Candidatus Thioglobus sp.]|jgi:hypothetical protein|uniref:hypothetical protein n=1 Tax=unclassified Candidatus Pseudothioglobus TaxID=3072908 RepID=UPI002324CD01|nr:hypothetical protein [Candidatus Thioglobus sp.]MDB4038124.1 hypothetical protein [Candidatus Thioglobus sp.]MDB9788394.1 hypothetical protein [Candidatus Thioglobus sp.]MDB9933859.1 hypothetical protein [Candidatus Thioglobus sp.]MDB9951591.1 hypothetical protein [Candidatus Thioglobus sp.]|tara:strand:- start:516 stop:893 length:378 start_codon:yes stop_codon:yes gene_type:complete